jgi:Arc/MetJ family transcription regulator
MKTTVDVDRELADAAAKVLGTHTLKETVNGALREIVRAEGRRRLAARVRNGTLPVPTPEELARLRAPQLPPGALSWFVDDDE